MLKLIKGFVFAIIVFVVIVACQNKDNVGVFNGKSLGSDEFSKMLERDFGFDLEKVREHYKELPADKFKIALRNELKQIFADYYTQYMFYQEAKASGFLDDPEVKQKTAEVQADVVFRYMGKAIWERQIKPRIKGATDEQVKNEDFTPYLLQRKGRHILLTFEKRTPAKALAEILALKKRVGTEGDFAQLARTYSEDPGTKDRGGDLGWVSRAVSFVPAFKNAFFQAKVGEISEPVKTDYGYHIILIDEDKKLALAEAKADQALVSYIEKEKQGIVRKNSIDGAEAYTKELRKKYQSKIAFYPERFFEYLKTFEQYVNQKFPETYQQFQKEKAPTGFFQSKLADQASLKTFLEAKNPQAYHDFLRESKDMILSEVKGADQATVKKAFQGIGQELQLPMLLDQGAFQEFIQHQFIDHALRYLEGINLGYGQEEKLKQQVIFNLVHFQGSFYQQKLREKLKGEFLDKLTEKSMRSYYENHLKEYQNDLPNNLEEADFLKQIVAKLKDGDWKSKLSQVYVTGTEGKYVLKSGYDEKLAWQIMNAAGIKQTQSFEDVKETVLRNMLADEEEAKMKALMQELKKKYGIQFFNDQLEPLEI